MEYHHIMVGNKLNGISVETLLTIIPQQEFMTWFNIKDVLDENTAGNLLNMINAIPKVHSGKTEPPAMRAGDMWFRELV